MRLRGRLRLKGGLRPWGRPGLEGKSLEGAQTLRARLMWSDPEVRDDLWCKFGLK